MSDEPEAEAAPAWVEIPEGAELLTYAEAGERLGVDASSIKRRAQRWNWLRVRGNDNRTRVAVPAEVLAEAVERQAEAAAGPPPPPPPPPGVPELAAELARLAEDLRQARALADARQAEAVALRAELERLRQAAAEPVPFLRQPLPPGYAVERNRLDGLHRWRRLADGTAGPPAADRWSAWRGAWAEHRRSLRRSPDKA